MWIQRLYRKIEYALTLKYFKKIEYASPRPAADFDLDGFRKQGRLHNVRSEILDRIMLAVLWLLREFWPNLRIGRLLIVTRASDVRQVLEDAEHFIVPFGPEMEKLAGANSVLGLDGTEHTRLNQLILDVLRPSDMDAILGSTRKMTVNLIATSAGRIDAMRDLITRVSTETCSDYFGLSIEDHDSFAEWSMAMSTLLFADPFGDARTREVALAGAAKMRQVIHRAIKRARVKPNDATVIGRLLQRQQQERDEGSQLKPELTDDVICGILMSLVTGFIPTNTLAGGKVLQELLRSSDRFDEAKALAREGERDALRGMVLEAARLNPALSPGQWRYALKEQSIAGKLVAKDTVLMVSTKSALRDRRAVSRPSAFQKDRKLDPNLMFGFGPHKCLGARIATEHITEILLALFALPNLRKASGNEGRFAWVGPFPERLDMEFDKPPLAAPQSMLTICVPLKSDSYRKEVERLIAALDQNPGMKRALDDTDIVHFASLTLIEAGDAARPNPYLILELNVDGTPETAIPTVARLTEPYLKPILACTEADGRSLEQAFEVFSLDLKTRLGGATGLNFNGTPEFSVAAIRRQKKLADFTREAVGFFVERRAGVGRRALPVLRFVRDVIRQNEQAAMAALGSEIDWDVKRDGFSELMQRAKEFERDLILPGRKRLLVSDWVERTNEDAFYRFLKSWDFWRPAAPFVLFALLMSIAIYFWIDIGHGAEWPGKVLISLTGGLVATVMLVLSLVAAFLLWLRYHERTDVPDDRNPETSHIESVTAKENRPGYAQNHFIAVTPLKPGLFRKLTLALSLWGIKQLVHHAYRPGFVLNMGTIHYAKWFRLPKTNKLIFLANYDGSWESYLEDFVMKAHAGQTAAWSNGVGFPKTRLLVYQGAQDGDRFKRWVRRQQVPTQFWYTCFQDLTTDQIRNNAIIHQGVVRAHTDSAARAWLACFGSMQRPDHAIETSEIQSLVFRGFKKSPYAVYALLQLPRDARLRAGWLKGLIPGPVQQDGIRSFKAESTSVSFGENPLRVHQQFKNLATFVGFSAAGLKKLGLPDDSGLGLTTFAGAFSIGMANRGRILGDLHDSARSGWRWSDATPTDDTAGAPVVDAILIIYGEDMRHCTEVLGLHEKNLGGNAFLAIKAEPIDHDEFREHFGFRDGISQPTIRGTERSVDGVNERDIVEPGEFLLGYRNDQGYYPPAIRVGVDTDLEDRLPDVIAEKPSAFPPFRVPDAPVRDFGRNGTFLVVRQIQQHVERFESFTHREALRLRTPTARQIAGAEITQEWIAAKMMGRWKNGAPLVLRPVQDKEQVSSQKASEKRWDTANDFAFAQDDPQGLRCPFGAHIRRANPRDGLKVGDSSQQSITNRHRLLRRGRTYQLPARAGETMPERGLVFACICADLERQFEFVQQTWIGSSSFHGLSGEVDPIIGAPDKAGRFTIPTPSGPITLRNLESFVTVRAGGYFFMPSYSALQYLWDISNAPTKSSPE